MKSVLLIVGLTALSMVAGCTQPQQPASDIEQGLIILLPGVEGSGWQFKGTIAGLRDAGVGHSIEIFPWGTPPFHSIENLTNYEANLERARRIAERILDYEKENPASPVTLVGYSGGGGLAILATEALPEGASLERLVLVSAAISPDYDLEKILSRTSYGVISFYSERDWFILGLGTQMFGTIDRKKTDSAGKIGFRRQDGGLLDDPRLRQIGWKEDWIRYGHLGGHIGWLSRPWARDVLAPAILMPLPQ